MALSCVLNRLCGSQSILRAQSLKTLSNQVLRTSTNLSSNRREFYHESQIKQPILQNRSALQPLSNLIIAKHFTSTSPQLSAEKGHDHVNIWKLERLLSALMLPLIPSALIFPCAALDTAVAVVAVMHTHWGLEAIVVDYMRPLGFGPAALKVGLTLLYVFSALLLAGLLNLIYNDSGLANTFLTFWKL